MPALRLVLASNNAKKLAELRALLGRGAVDLVTQGALGVAECDEPFHSFIENALTKARHAAAATGCAAIADDSGLCVDSLGGLPGVGSAHFASLAPVEVGAAHAPQADDRESRRRLQDDANNTLLLQRLQGVADRRAHFICTLVAVRHAQDPEPLVAVGRWPGEILQTPRGEGGFGYNPVMWIPALGQSVAEMDEATKNTHSHRALAMAQMLALLRDVWHL